MVEHAFRLREQAHLESEIASLASPASPASPASEMEDSRLLEDGIVHGNGPHDDTRPLLRIRHGPLRLLSRYLDAVDFWEEKLRTIDQEITDMRKKVFPPQPLAFVTMDSVAACVRIPHVSMIRC